MPSVHVWIVALSCASSLLLASTTSAYRTPSTRFSSREDARGRENRDQTAWISGKTTGRWEQGLWKDSDIDAALLRDRVQQEIGAQKGPQRDRYCAAPFSLAEDYEKPFDNAELVLVQVITRHGDRAPQVPHAYRDVTWDCDGGHQYSFLSTNQTGIQPDRAMVVRELVSIPINGPFSTGFWSGSCDVGQLTPEGAAYQHTFGEELRKIYVDKLDYMPQKYGDAARLYVRTSASSRTKQSATRLIAGLYPPQYRPDDSITNLVTVPSAVEYITRNHEQCPKQAKLFHKIFQSKPFRKYMKLNKHLHRKLRTVLGKPRNPAWPSQSFSAYVDHLLPRRCHQLPLPCASHGLRECLTERDVDQVLENADWEMAYLFRDAARAEKHARITIGTFLGELRSSLLRHAKAALEHDAARGAGYDNEEGRAGQKKSAFEVYVGHDDTLAALLGAFRARDLGAPSYSSNIVVELWKTPGAGEGRFNRHRQPVGTLARYDDFYIRITHDGQVIDAPWCDMRACPVRVLWENTKPLVPEDVRAECGLDENEDEDDDVEDDEE